jgi:ABC-type transport system involved in cytochrome c biogenesis ATPase subunit
LPEQQNVSDRDPKAALFRSKAEAEASDSDALVVASRDRWNDFGYSIMAEVGLRSPSGVEWFDARFAIEDEKNLASFAQQRLANRTAGVLLSELSKPFASLLTETKHYSLARRAIGADRARGLLLSVNDIALLSDAKQEVPRWPDFFESEVYHLAMVRSSESYFAVRRGSWVLAGRQTSATDALRPFTAVLKGRGPKVTFDFPFNGDNVLRGRIAVLIGKNGCGKTSSLAKLARGLVDLKTRVATIEERPEVNQVLAFSHTASLPLFVPRASSSGSARVRVFALDPLTSRRRPREESDTRLLVDIARSHDDEGRPSLNYLTSILEEEFPSLKVFVPVKANASATYSSKHGGYRSLRDWMRGGEQRQLESAAEIDHSRDLLFLGTDVRPRTPSLGQLSFVRFALTALANAGPASVFVIDEPENFLHPNLVSRFMRVLHRVLTSTSSVAILATHSPFVVREVQSAQVHVMRLSEDGSITVSRPLLQTLGANVASISSEVFGDDTADHLYQELLAKAQADNLSFDVALERYSSDLSIEALMLLRSRLEGQP